MATTKQRTMKVLHEVAGTAHVRVTEGKVVDQYRVRRIPSDFGKAFNVTKTAGKVSRDSSRHHHVLLEAGEVATCSCPGGVYRGVCRHVAMVKVLVGRGVI
jgi:hypothetical protein